MLHRIIIGEDVNNIVAIKRLETKHFGDYEWECKCGLCGKRIIRTEIKLRLMTALPCAECCKKYHLEYIPREDNQYLAAEIQ